MNRMYKRFLPAALVMALAVSPAVVALARSDDATITFSGGSVATGIGYTWGKGVLHFKGKDYPFTVDGLSIVDVGAAHIEGTGEVFNLQTLDNFAGNYVAAGAGATLAGGGSVAALENQAGVIIHFHSTTQGLKLALSANGISIKLK